MKNKKGLIILIAALFICLLGCGQSSNEIERQVLAGHKWGETFNEHNSKGTPELR